MHLSNEIKNNNDAVNFYRRVRDFFTFINVILVNFAASVKDDSLILISSFSFINNIF